MTQDENAKEQKRVFKIDGTDYTEDQLNDRQKYLISAINISRERTMDAQIAFDRERIALDGLMDQLIKTVKDEQPPLQDKKII